MMKKRLVVSIALLILLIGSFLINGEKVKGVEKVVIPFSSKDIKVELDRQWVFILGINKFWQFWGGNFGGQVKFSVKFSDIHRLK